jgi:hypothetical protein
VAAQKFKPGDLVKFEYGFAHPRSASGLYSVVRALPAGADGQRTYQVKSPDEPHARIAMEHQLSPAPVENESPGAARRS